MLRRIGNLFSPTPDDDGDDNMPDRVPRQPPRMDSSSRQQHQHQTESSSTQLDNIFKTALLLRRLNLPPDLIPTILDYGEFWATTVGMENREPITVANNPEGVRHSYSAIPSHVHRGSLRAVTLETVSHDQGFSWDRAHHGTYESSWTWFVAGISDDSQNPPVPRQTERIVTNVHASREEKTHRFVLRWGDPTPWVQNALAELKAGKAIVIGACALYPAWTNHVTRTKIEFTYQPVRKVP